jgi:putative endonuclease
MFYFVYVLLSEKDNRLYTGYSCDLKKRIELHNKGKVESTKERRPLRLIYFEGCLNQQDASRREKYLKSGNGKIFLKNRLKNYWCMNNNKNPTG